MKATPVLMLVIMVAVICGCASSNVSVDVRDADEDVTSNYKPDESGARTTGDGGEAMRPRPPFVNLSTYEWDYLDWLQEFTAVVAGVRLPDSAETTVRLRFLPATGAAPEIVVDCRTTEAACAALDAQMAALAGYPPLPDGYPHGELEVLLSRLP